MVCLLRHRLRPRAAPGPHGVEQEVSRQVRPGLGQAARGDARTAEAAWRGAGRHRAHASARRDPGLGLAVRQREEALRTPDGGLRRLPGERRPQRRSSPRRDRRLGRARQHSGHLHLRRQRGEPGRHGDRLVQRDDGSQPHPPHPRAATVADRPVRRPRRVGDGRLRPALLRRVGVGRQHAVPVGQAGRFAPRRAPRRDGRILARPHQEQRWSTHPVHTLHRPGPDDPGGRRHPAGGGHRRRPAGADARHEPGLHLRPRRRPRAAHRPILRDLREPGDLQGRLVGMCEGRPRPLGPDQRDHGETRTGCVRPGQGHLGALLPAR